MRLLVCLLGLAVLAGCGAFSDSTRQHGASSTGSIQWTSKRPIRLSKPPHNQVEVPVWDDLPGAYANLLARPRYTVDGGESSRVVRLRLVVGASARAELDLDALRAWFEAPDGSRTQVRRAPCGHDRLAGVVDAGDEKFGCLGYRLPEGSGRLQLRSAHPHQDGFNYFIDVPADSAR